MMDVSIAPDDLSTAEKTVAIQIVASVAVVATFVTLFVLGLVQPAPPDLTPRQRQLSNVALALVGWLWGTVGFLLIALTDSEFYPPVPEMFIVAGSSIILIANGVFVSTPTTSLFLRAVGYALLGSLSIYAAYSLYHSPWSSYRHGDADTETKK